MRIYLNSRLKEKLLGYVFSHPDEEYYTRELAVYIQDDPGNLSRELRKLEQEGLFSSKTKGRTKLYRLNKSYPLFKELKDIVFKTVGVAGELKKLANAFEQIKLALIHGSCAQGAEQAGSDVDMILVGEPPVDFVKRLRKLEERLGRSINYTWYPPQEYIKESRTKGSFLNMVLKKKTIILKGNAHGPFAD